MKLCCTTIIIILRNRNKLLYYAFLFVIMVCLKVSSLLNIFIYYVKCDVILYRKMQFFGAVLSARLYGGSSWEKIK